MGFAVTLENGRRPGVETVMPSRQPRPLTNIGRNGERNGRTRNFYDRFQAFSDEDNNRSRWVSGVTTLLVDEIKFLWLSTK